MSFFPVASPRIHEQDADKHFPIHPLAKLMKAIPICSQAGKEQLHKILHECGDEIAKGALVGIFAEGVLSRTGEMQEFKRGSRSPWGALGKYLQSLWRKRLLEDSERNSLSSNCRIWFTVVSRSVIRTRGTGGSCSCWD